MDVEEAAGDDDAAKSQECKFSLMAETEFRDIVPSRIPTTGGHHQPWMLTAQERAVYRERSTRSRLAKAAALRGEGPTPLHPVNTPVLHPEELMPLRQRNGLHTLSLFSGGGGLDLGFDRAGFEHRASYEILSDAARTLAKAEGGWEVYGGEAGDVTTVDWRKRWKGKVQLVHGGPPCQPFSSAGRQAGASDSRDMFPEFVRAVLETSADSFVAENVPALASAKFAQYVRANIIGPLSSSYRIRRIELRAEHFGVPQVRRRVMFIGFKSAKAAKGFQPPTPTHIWGPSTLNSELTNGPLPCMGLRGSLGLPDIGYDDLSPTIRSGLTGPRHTTSILNSTAAKRVFDRLQVWPNGVARTREAARAFVPENGHFRLAIPDVALLQGFPEWWPFEGATYMVLGQIGNAVPPPVAYAVATAVASALSA